MPLAFWRTHATDIRPLHLLEMQERVVHEFLLPPLSHRHTKLMPALRAYELASLQQQEQGAQRMGLVEGA